MLQREFYLRLQKRPPNTSELVLTRTLPPHDGRGGHSLHAKRALDHSIYVWGILGVHQKVCVPSWSHLHASNVSQQALLLPDGRGFSCE